MSHGLVGFHRTATKQMHQSLAGDLTLAFEMLDLPSDPGAVAAHLLRRAGLTIWGRDARARSLERDTDQTVGSTCGT